MDNRLKKQKDFDIVFNKGKRVYTKTLTLLYIVKDSFKVGISLSKKHGKATVRNRIKRLIRAAVREITINNTKNYYVVILPKVSEKYDFFEIKKDLSYALIKGEIING